MDKSLLILALIAFSTILSEFKTKYEIGVGRRKVNHLWTI